MKGIILAGGSGTRLYPLTRGISKQLVPDLRQAHDLLSPLCSHVGRDPGHFGHYHPHEQEGFKRLLGDGRGLDLKCPTLSSPRRAGWPRPFTIGRDFVGNDSVALVLGDNIFYGHGLVDDLRAAAERKTGATVFAYQVRRPEEYGVIVFDKGGRPVSIEEKPKEPKSDFAVTGLYFYDNRVLDVAANLKPSPRGELEITDVNRALFGMGRIERGQTGPRGIAWLDTGTHASLLQASVFIETIQDRQGCGWPARKKLRSPKATFRPTNLRRLAEPMKKNDYGQYLLRLLE
jgi:glucose-1-phosphate thymidylyltransferase